MANHPENTLADIQLDVSNLYREESYTDLKVGSLRRLTPVTEDGEQDSTRPVLFMGQAQLMSQMGPLPVSCEIDADGGHDAFLMVNKDYFDVMKNFINQVCDGI